VRTIAGLRKRRAALAIALAAIVGATACGKKGPPLAPLRLVPGPVADVTVRRVGGEVQIHFKLPTANANGPGRIDLDRVEIYAVTAAPGTVIPPNRELLSKTYTVGTIAVKPPPVEGDGEPPAGTPPDTRPGPGDDVSFTEELTEARLKPAPLPKAPVPPGWAVLHGPVPALPVEASIPDVMILGEPVAAPGASAPAAPLPPVVPLGAPAAATAPAATAPAATAPTANAPAGTPVPGAPAPGAPAVAPVAPLPPSAPAQTTVVRIYAIRGVAKSGRPGQPSARLTVPIVAPPLPPGAPKVTFTETALTLEWSPPPVKDAPTPAGEPPTPAAEAPTPPAFNVYRKPPQPVAAPPAAAKPAAAPVATGKPDAPLNPKPLAAAKLELPGVTLGTEQCFVVRSVHVVQNVAIESDASPTTCVTPKDVFPPAPPQNLGLLLLDGAIELVWDAGTEADLAGYTVLRADAPGDTLRPLTPSPVRESTFRDTTVKPGARYVYAVVAVDKAGNASQPSARVEGIAR